MKRLVVVLAMAGLATGAHALPWLHRPVIGIDLGATYAHVGVYEPKGDTFEIIGSGTPAYVAWDANDELLVGESARIQAIENPHKTIFGVKQLLGWSYNDESVQAAKKLMPYEIIDKDGRPFVQVTIKGETRQLSPEEITAVILSKLKQNAEEHLGQEVFDAVIAVPAYFNDAQRQATRDAAAIAGLTLHYVISTPKAAVTMAYGSGKTAYDVQKNVLVLDLGGSTCVATLLAVDGGVHDVLATSRSHLGGEDFDQRIMQHFITEWKQEKGIDISSDRRALQKLRVEVERVKRTLSTERSARLEIESLANGKDLSETLSRTEFEALNEDLFKKALDLVDEMLENSPLAKAEMDEIMLVGGSSSIPKLRLLIQDYFNGLEPVRITSPEEVMAHGAAIIGSIIGWDASAEPIILPRIDVLAIAHSFGIETVGGLMTKVVRPGTVVPHRETKIFSTNEDNQSSVLFKVFEGERVMAEDNRLLGQLELTGLAPAPRGAPQIEVTFYVDPDCSVHVAAEDTSTGKTEKITFPAAEEIDRSGVFCREDEKAYDDPRAAAEAYATMKRFLLEQNAGELFFVGPVVANKYQTVGSVQADSKDRDEL